jgi:FlaA1/EpsC-like NDP-sugar epimerase
LVLDMGQPVRILEVAERLAATGHRPVDIVFTGLRPGEKLHEVLLGHDEHGARPFHPLITHVPVPPLAPAKVEILKHVSRADLVGALSSLCTGELLEASLNLDA